MHTKTDSDVTSLPASTPPRSPPRRGGGAVYYVESPSQHDVDKMSYGSSPTGSPTRHHYHCSPIHHSRESSTSRFSSSLIKPHRAGSGWRRIHGRRLGYSGAIDDDDDGGDDGDGDDDDGGGPTRRFYVGCFMVCFVGLFALFSLILWGVSKSFRPHILVKQGITVLDRDFIQLTVVDTEPQTTVLLPHEQNRCSPG
ncbi:hypothetical protein RND81_09G147400 [Saponaria officinalis]|uniref:Uncharacterized protein n=1 Tax=Saponaria officinalis TaxID=3572 RepID=A0AAW1IMJ9_SAPOF